MVEPFSERLGTWKDGFHGGSQVGLAVGHGKVVGRPVRDKVLKDVSERCPSRLDYQFHPISCNVQHANVSERCP